MENKEQNNLWNERIASYRSSGLSLTKWCEKNNISKWTMRNHLYPEKKKSKHSDQSLNFIPATVVNFSKQSLSNEPIVLELGKVRVSVNNSTDLSLLKKVVEVLL